MALKTRVRAEGVISSQGSGFTIDKSTSNSGFGPWSVGAGSITATATLTAGEAAGVNEISGSAVITGTMPTAASSVGSYMVFRNGSVHAHVLTASQETNGTLAFTDGTDHGSKLTLPAVEDASVALMSDGVNFLVLGNSGSLTIDGA